MQTQDADILIAEANDLLNTATEELQRPEEDVMAQLVCYNSRQSIVNYLSAFLINNGIELKKPVTMAGLMDQCRAVDDRFQLIDISQIFCSHDVNDNDYCINLHKVNDCLQIAKQTRDISITKSPSY